MKMNKIQKKSYIGIKRRSFDAWGRPRHPDNWSYTNIPDWTHLDRGFTGHEHLPEFGLINMNGRMYDPLIGRFLSPDNYVADATNPQDYNRYSYARNNPLKYTDPTGEKLKWWQWALIGAGADMFTGGAISASAGLTAWGATMTAGMTAYGATMTAGMMAYGATMTVGMTAMAGTTCAAAFLGAPFSSLGATIGFGLLATSPPALLPLQALVASTDLATGFFLGITGINPDYMERAFTMEAGLFLHIPVWETRQTLMGNIVSHFRNMIGQVDNVEVDGWTVLVNQNKNDGERWGMTLGPYINSKNIELYSDMYYHEYGHTIQSRILGPLYVSKVGIPSSISVLFGNEYHGKSWYEVWANHLSGVPESDDYLRKFRPNKWTSWLYWPAVVLFPIFPY